MKVDADISLSVHRSVEMDTYRPELLPPDLVKMASQQKSRERWKYVLYSIIGSYVFFMLICFPISLRIIEMDLTEIRPTVQEPGLPMKYLFRPELVVVSDELLWSVNDDI